MTTKKDASSTLDYVGVVDSGPFPPIKRYDLGTRFYNSLSVPEIVETPDGKYVTHDDYLIMVKINDYLQARLAKQAAEMEAIGAGGVSGKRITDDGALQALQEYEKAYHRMIVSGTPQDCRAHDAARVAFWRVFGGQS
ncbi:hypothetical protein [Pusillimonas minor]|uniref:Uncharacterized protein n=1 Tax=Pusillimonas minor TaxID=2697024 RepID=A0A842HLE9_9BURK|nr:hypothetical protein [Pusillimonas minor]MBC2768592.1 hypothetical protein [Pusillimonas minor]